MPESVDRALEQRRAEETVKELVDSYRKGEDYKAKVSVGCLLDEESLDRYVRRYVDGAGVFNSDVKGFSAEAHYLSGRIESCTAVSACGKNSTRLEMEFPFDDRDEVLENNY